MKKFVCLLMVVTMVLALGITVYARYELCPDCEVALVYGSWTEPTSRKFCDECGKKVAAEYECEGWYCSQCGIGQIYDSRELVLSCGH